VYRTFFSASPRGTSSVSARPDFISFWKDALPNAILIGGPTKAPVTLVVVSDLECPVCRSFHATLTDVLARRPEDVRAFYLSFPLSYHRFAEAAARAVECAEAVGAFRRLVDVIYENQDSLGLKSWSSYAQAAGIVDTASFAACATNHDPVPRLKAGRDFGKRINLTGTPTVLINGWRYPYTPSTEDLDRAIDAVLAGKEPSGQRNVIAEREGASKN
jgi:protein-disulfide isomerase